MNLNNLLQLMRQKIKETNASWKKMVNAQNDARDLMKLLIASTEFPNSKVDMFTNQSLQFILERLNNKETLEAQHEAEKLLKTLGIDLN